MQISPPALCMPPLAPPPSIVAQINKLLDQTHFYLQKFELANARKCLFEAYLKYQLDDALMDDKKSYFYTINGYILQLMAELSQFDEIRNAPPQGLNLDDHAAVCSHLLQHSAYSYLKAMEIIENQQSAERATPRLFLGSLFYFMQNYESATVFFRQAEALALGAEGPNSVLYCVSSYNVLLCQLQLMLLCFNQTNQPLGERFTSIYAQPAPLPTTTSMINNPRFASTTFKVEQRDISVEQVKSDAVSDMFQLGGRLDLCQDQVRLRFEGNRFAQLFRYEPVSDQKYSAEDVYSLWMQAKSLSERLHRLLGNHQYQQNATDLMLKAQYLERQVNQQVKLRNAENTLVTVSHKDKTVEEEALQHLKKRFAKVPQRPLASGMKAGKKKKGKKK